MHVLPDEVNVPMKIPKYYKKKVTCLPRVRDEQEILTYSPM